MKSLSLWSNDEHIQNSPCQLEKSWNMTAKLCLTSLNWSVLCRHRSAETGNAVSYCLTGGGQNILILQTMPYTSAGRGTFVAALVFFTAIIRHDGESPTKLKKYAKGPHGSFFSHNKDVVNFEAACRDQGVFSLRSKSFRGIWERRKTEERDFRYFSSPFPPLLLARSLFFGILPPQ